MEDKRYLDYLTIQEEYWMVPYIGRRVNEHYYDMFDHNGYYPSDDLNHLEYFENDIVINLKPEVFDDIIENISYYKVKDHGLFYRGSDTRALTAHDRKLFREVLDKCTISIAPVVLETLLVSPVKEGWEIKRVSKKSIVLQHNNDEISVPKDYVEQMIDVARLYPDLIDNNDFWKVNEKHLKTKYKDAIFALLFSFSKGLFPDIHFGETAQERIKREDEEEKAKKQIVVAIKENRCKRVTELVSSTSVISEDAVDAALQEKATDILMILVEKTTNQSSLKKIGEYAIDNRATELFRKVIDNPNTVCEKLMNKVFDEHRIEYVVMLLDKGCALHIRSDSNMAYETSELLSLIDYREVMFSAKALEQIYREEGQTPIKKIINNYHVGDSSYIKNGKSGYDSNETAAFVYWLMEKEDYDLIDFAAERNIKTNLSYGKEENLAVSIFNESENNWRRISRLFNNDISFYKCFHLKNYKLLKYLVTCQTVSLYTVKQAFDPGSNVDDDMLRVVMQNLDVSVDDTPSGGLPVWYSIIKLSDLSSFELFFTKYCQVKNSERDRKEIYDYFIWNIHDPQKARILVHCCDFPESLVNESELSSLISQGKALQWVEMKYNKGKEKKEEIPRHKVGFYYHDNRTWEIKGKPSRGRWDTPYLDDLHYLVYVDDSGKYHIEEVKE